MGNGLRFGEIYFGYGKGVCWVECNIVWGDHLRCEERGLGCELRGLWKCTRILNEMAEEVSAVWREVFGVGEG